MKRAVSQAAALHIAFWQYDPWYRRAWLIWPQAIAVLLAGWLIDGRSWRPAAHWGEPADCSDAASPGCAATRQVMFLWAPEIGTPTLANQVTVDVDRAAFERSAAADQPKLAAALGAYSHGQWAKAVDILGSATPSDPNVQYLTALSLLVPNTTDAVHRAQDLLRRASGAGHRQAAAVLGRTLMVGSGALPRDEVAGRRLIEDAARAGDSYAMRLAAAGYVSGEFGGYDFANAVALLRRAAAAGEPVAMAQLAYAITTGRGGLARDDARAHAYLRRSAQAGYLEAQLTLGRWFTLRYYAHQIEDPSEAIKWYQRAYQRGGSLAALVSLATLYRVAHGGPWLDTKRSFALLQNCASYKYFYCQSWLARAYNDGAGVAQDRVKAYAHFKVAQQLGDKNATLPLQQLDAYLDPVAKASASALAASITASLKPIPPVVKLQSLDPGSAPPPTAD